MEKRKTAASEQTKRALAAALKELMAQNPIDKITIHDVTERCGIRRQNFYYHFQDVYDLLRWSFRKKPLTCSNGTKARCFGRKGFCSFLII